jgi:hypothetical protein
MKQQIYIFLVLSFFHCAGSEYQTQRQKSSLDSNSQDQTIQGVGKAKISSSTVLAQTQCKDVARLDAQSKFMKKNSDGSYGGIGEKLIMVSCTESISENIITCECSFRKPASK